MRWILLLAVVAAIVVVAVLAFDVDAPETTEREPDRAVAEPPGPDGPEKPTSARRHVGSLAVTGVVMRDGRPTAARIVARWISDPEPKDGTWVDPPSPEIVGRAEAGAEGRFRIGGLAPGRYELSAEAADGAEGRGRAYLLRGRDEDTEIHIVWGPADLRGRAVHADGRPFDGVVVVCPQADGTWPVGGRFLRPEEEGRFHMRGLRPGRYWVSLHSPGRFYTTSQAVEVPCEGEPVFVADRDLTSVLGRVVSLADGSPVPGARLRSRGEAGDRLASGAETLTGPEGAFVLSHPGAIAGVTVTAKGFVPSSVRAPRDGVSVTVRLSAAVVRIRGRVVEAGSARPVPGVPVLSCAPSSWTGGSRNKTDEDGRFEIGPFSPRPCLVFVRTDEWVSKGLEDGVLDGPNPLAVDARAGVGEILLDVVSSPRVAGTVTGPVGRPVAGAKVSAELHWSVSQKKPWLRAKLQTTTARDGSYSLGGLAPGIEYTLKVVTEAHPKVITPKFRVAAGETHDLDVGLGEGHFVDLLVLEKKSGAPIFGARVSGRVKTESGELVHVWTLTSTASDGKVRAGPFPAGELSIRVLHRDYLDSPWMLATPVVALERGLVIAGRVLMPDGTPTDGARLMAVSLPEEREVENESRKSGGRFRLSGLARGTYHVGASLRTKEGWHEAHEKVIAGTEDVELKLALVKEAGATADVTANLVDPDGRPVALANVRRVVFRERRASKWNARLREGQAIFASVRPEPYWIEVLDARGHGDVLLGDTLAGPFSPETGTVTVRLPAAGTIRGTVLDQEGGPVKGVRLEATAVLEEETKHPARLQPHDVTWTDAGGRFALTGLGTTRYRVTLRAAANHIAPKPLTTTAGAAPLTIRLGGTVSVTLTILDHAGQPVSGFRTHIKGVEPRTSGPDGRLEIVGLKPDVTYDVRGVPPTGRHDLGPLYRRGWTPADETIRLVRVYAITGTVVDELGEPVADARIWRTDTNRRVSRSREDGRFFILRLPQPTTIPLVALGQSMKPAESKTKPVKATTGDDSVRLVVDRGGMIRVRIDGWPSGLEAYGVLTCGTGADTPLDVTVSVDGNVWQEGLPRGEKATLFVHLPERGAYALGVDLAPGREVHRIPLSQGLSIAGTVVAPKEASTVWVTATRGGIMASAEVKEDGSFVIRGLPPGPYRVTGAAYRDRKLVAKASQQAEAGTRADLVLR